ncbi:polymorphic toxin type 15 domain-containing protein, partial [Pseudomonas spelaei]
MKKLAALHNPDLYSGGMDVIGDFGDRQVNSSIGAQWRSRVSELDKVAGSICSGLMKPDTHLGENARQNEVSDDQTT